MKFSSYGVLLQAGATSYSNWFEVFPRNKWTYTYMIYQTRHGISDFSWPLSSDNRTYQRIRALDLTGDNPSRSFHRVCTVWGSNLFWRFCKMFSGPIWHLPPICVTELIIRPCSAETLLHSPIADPPNLIINGQWAYLPRRLEFVSTN